jgi:hypothetical protein
MVAAFAHRRRGIAGILPRGAEREKRITNGFDRKYAAQAAE